MNTSNARQLSGVPLAAWQVCFNDGNIYIGSTSDPARVAGIKEWLADKPMRVGLTDAAIIAGWEAKADALERPEHIGDISFGKAWQLRDCAAELRARIELAPQQPAEAQAQGGGDAWVERWWTRDDQGVTLEQAAPASAPKWVHDAKGQMKITAPPSAPVAVEAMPGLRRELSGIMRRDDAGMVSIEPNEAAAILRALAQQPAARHPMDADCMPKAHRQQPQGDQ